MPEPRTFESREGTRALRITFEAQSSDEARAMRRWRAGQRGRLPVEIRNGLPFKPYIYGGVGWDIYTGEDDSDA